MLNMSKTSHWQWFQYLVFQHQVFQLSFFLSQLVTQSSTHQLLYNPDMSKPNDPIKLLAQLVKSVSISTDPNHRDNCQQTAHLIAATLTNIGFTVTLHQHEKGLPLIVAKLQLDASYPTIGIYNHYDVQPVDPVSEWQSPPFQLTEREGKLFGRGTADNKGHLVQNITAILLALHANTLKTNIIFVIEGEEESGSDSFEPLITKLHDQLKLAQAWFVTDMGMADAQTTKIYYALRGLVAFELIVQTADQDLHSGVFGNSVFNPVEVIARLIAPMKDNRGRVTMPGFLVGQQVISTGEKMRLESQEQKYSSLTKTTNLSTKAIEPKFPHLSAKIYPSIDFHGIEAGYTGEGFKTIIPSFAKLKFSCRLVEYQQPDRVVKAIKEHVARYIPKKVRYTLTHLSSAPPFYSDPEDPTVQRVAKLFTEFYSQECLLTRSGGSVPAAEVLQRKLKVPVIATGCLRDFHIHAPNEHIIKEEFLAGIEALRYVYERVEQ